jgi:hypothetical protein
VAGYSEHGNETPGPIKGGGGGDFLTSGMNIIFLRRALFHGVGESYVAKLTKFELLLTIKRDSVF